MKKQISKKVILKDTFLRNLRKNLRIILQLAFEDVENNNAIYKTYLKSPIMCCRRSDCITYHRLIEKKNGVTKKNSYFSSIAPSLYKYLTLDEIMDVDLVWVPFGYIEKWACIECYESYFKPLRGHLLAGVDL